MKYLLIAVSIFALLSLTIAGRDSKHQIKAWPVSKQKIEQMKFIHARQMTPKLMSYSWGERYKKNQKSEESFSKKNFPYESLGLKKNYGLISAQSPVRHQGVRGQCHNFAVTAAIEYSIWAGLEKENDFSEQCNAWHFFKDCTNCSGDPNSINDGGWPDKEAEFIKDKFMKFEVDWSYHASDASRCEFEYQELPYFKFSDIEVHQISKSEIKAAIDNNFVVIIGTYWKAAGWSEYGEYPYKESYSYCTPETCGAHAVLVVGYDDDYYGIGKGGFIFKNSWGIFWGNKRGSKPEGFGVIPYTYYDQFGLMQTAVTHKNAIEKEPKKNTGCSI